MGVCVWEWVEEGGGVERGVVGWGGVERGVVVVVLTVCVDDVSVHATKHPAPDFGREGGRHVAVDMTPLALHLCAKP